MNEHPIDRPATDPRGAQLRLETRHAEDCDERRESLRGGAESPTRRLAFTTDAYLAVLDRCGVARLVDETDHAARFLARRCYRAPPYGESLWWATLTPQAAETIRYLIDAGLNRLAMECLAQEAHQHGSIPPPESSDTKNRPAA